MLLLSLRFYIYSWTRNVVRPAGDKALKLKIVLVVWGVNSMCSVLLRGTTMFWCSRYILIMKFKLDSSSEFLNSILRDVWCPIWIWAFLISEPCYYEFYISLLWFLLLAHLKWYEIIFMSHLSIFPLLFVQYEWITFMCLSTQVSKALYNEYIATKAKNKQFKGLGLEHMNKPCPVIPSQLIGSTIRGKEFQVISFYSTCCHVPIWNYSWPCRSLIMCVFSFTSHLCRLIRST